MKTMKKLGAVVLGVAVLTGTSFAGEFGGRHGGRAKRMEKFDANKDGKLDDAEKAQLKQAKAQRRAEMLAKFDTNKDGKIDDEERKVAKEARVAERFDKLDSNNDGMLSIDEFKAGAAQKHGRRGAKQ